MTELMGGLENQVPNRGREGWGVGGIEGGVDDMVREKVKVRKRREGGKKECGGADN